jgi:hypothetical protein
MTLLSSRFAQETRPRLRPEATIVVRREPFVRWSRFPLQRSWRESCVVNIVSNKQKVRFKPDSPAARWLDVSTDAIGTVICRYRILREGEPVPDRLDVRFDERRFAWGVPEKEFEAILK